MNLGSMYKHSADFRTFVNNDLPSIYVGLELELENLTPIHVNAPPKMWEFRNEGTLRGDYTAEIVFQHPYFGKDIELAIGYYKEWLGNHHPKLSYRCSTHVHIDVRSLDVEEYLQYRALTILFEPVFYNLSSPERYINWYCVPYSRMQYLGEGDNIFALDINGDRYRGVNTQAVKKYGSVEFRMMGGCHDPEKLYKWIRTLVLFRSRAPEFEGAISSKLYESDKLVLELANILFAENITCIAGNPTLIKSIQQMVPHVIHFLKYDSLSANHGRNIYLRPIAGA